MHVFVAMASGARGGGANHLLALLPALGRLGVRSTAWVGDDGPLAAMLRSRGVEAHALPLMGRRGDLLLGRRMMAAARRSGADLVHAHGTRAGVLAALGALGQRRPLPRVYTAHGLAQRAGRHPVGRAVGQFGEWLACRGSRAVVSVSAADLNVLQRLLRNDAVRTAHVPNVVLEAPTGPVLGGASASRQEARRRFGLPQAAAMVGTVSRLVPQKNVALLADAVALLTGAHLAVVGDGPLLGALRAHPLAAAGRLHLLGARDNVPEFLPALDVFALSSRWEGEPIALLEAMAHGLPWVATQTAGAQELQRSCATGTLVPEHEAEALARALGSLLRDPERARLQGRAGALAMQARTPERLAQQIAALYRSVCPRAFGPEPP